MTPMQRPNVYKRCVALALVMMLCLLPLASLAGDTTYGTITARSLNLRVAPSSDAQILTSYPSGTWVQVLETANGWHKVQIDKTVGYMSTQYVSLNKVTTVTDAKVSGATGYINLRASASASAAVLATYPNGTKVKILSHIDGFYQVQVGDKSGYMADHLVKLNNVKVLTYAVVTTANGGNLNVRVSPSMNAKVIQSFAPNQKVEILKKGKEWHKVRADGVTGYMRAEYLVLNGKPSPAPAPAGNIGVVNNPLATQVLNLRETPSLDARVLAYYANGKQVEVLATSADWYKVKVDNKTGYMMKKFVLVSDAKAPIPSTPFAATLKNPNGNKTVNFRDAASLNAKILAAYPVGKSVTVLELGTDWAKVSIDNTIGFVSSYFLNY